MVGLHENKYNPCGLLPQNDPCLMIAAKEKGPEAGDITISGTAEGREKYSLLYII